MCSLFWPSINNIKWSFFFSRFPINIAKRHSKLCILTFRWLKYEKLDIKTFSKKKCPNMYSSSNLPFVAAMRPCRFLLWMCLGLNIMSHLHWSHSWMAYEAISHTIGQSFGSFINKGIWRITRSLDSQNRKEEKRAFKGEGKRCKKNTNWWYIGWWVKLWFWKWHW